eukprot:177881_1
MSQVSDLFANLKVMQRRVLEYRHQMSKRENTVTHQIKTHLKHIQDTIDNSTTNVDEKVTANDNKMQLLNVLKTKYISESITCIQSVIKYINNQQNCIMFHKLKFHCIHYKYSSNHQYMQYLHKILVNPHLYADFKFNVNGATQFDDFLEWMSQCNQNIQYYPICYDCIIKFWSHKSITKSFLHYSSSSEYSMNDGLQSDLSAIMFRFSINYSKKKKKTENKILFDGDEYWDSQNTTKRLKKLFI